MSETLPALTPVEQTIYLTLGGRALDSRRRVPFLGDHMSDRIARSIGFDPERFPLMRGKIFDIAVRTKRLDELVAGFVQRNPDGLVLELGAGLDPRITRVEPPSTVDWYDIDLPGITEIRRRVLPERPNVHPIAADLDDAHWLDQLPTDRPAIAVADGLVAFFTEDQFATLLRRITGHLARGEVAFNSYTKLAMWAIQRMKGTNSIAPVARHPGFEGPHPPERWDPDLRFVEAWFGTRAPDVARLPLATRLLTRLAGRSDRLSWQGTVVLHYEF